jgi:hypothetical protein
MLTNVLGFYSRFNLTGSEIETGLYHFDIVYSPIISGWRYFNQSGSFDLFWLSHLERITTLPLIIIICCCFLLLCAYWIAIVRETRSKW